MPEFKQKIQEFSEDFEAYNSRYLKKLLKDSWLAYIIFGRDGQRNPNIFH